MELLIAIGMAMPHIIFPFSMNKMIDPKLVATLTILALEEDCKKSYPISPTNANTKKLPVPGPTKPS